MSEPIFQYTIHKKFWQLISIYGTKEIALTRGLENYYDYLNRVHDYPQERVYLTPEDCRHIVTAPHYCLACAYQEEKEFQGCEDSCEFCPLEVTETTLKCISPIFLEDDGSYPCLGGLFQAYIYYCNKLTFFEDMMEIELKDIKGLLSSGYNCKITRVKSKNNADFYYKEMGKINNSLHQIARTIANLPVKKGIKYI